jgi:hypothetical protein
MTSTYFTGFIWLIPIYPVTPYFVRAISSVGTPDGYAEVRKGTGVTQFLFDYRPSKTGGLAHKFFVQCHYFTIENLYTDETIEILTTSN